MKKLNFFLLILSSIFISSSALSQARLNIDSISSYKFPNGGFPNTNEVWGHVDSNGTEYALVGRSNGFSVISLADPANPSLVYSDTSSLTLWRDIKTWAGYAYVVNEDRNGLEIFDLRGLPNTVTKVGSYLGNSFPLQKAHNLYIDSNGVAYIFGSNNRLPNSAGTIFLDLNTDPENPIELGQYDSLYLHDGYVRDDTLYGGAVNDGKLIILDVSNKQTPRLLGSVTTPFSFTHNVWLSDDGNTAFTTDEVSGAFITAYDVTDPTNIIERDRIVTRRTTDVIPHNTHVYNDFLVTSYYTAGISVIDASNPDNLVEVGYFDTSPNFSGDGFNGNWGAYPFLPSGLILATDMQEGLVVLRPNYQRAAFLEIFLDNCSGSKISQARISLDGNFQALTNLVGKAEIGDVLDGFYTLTIDAKGYYPINIDSVEMRPGITKRLSLVMRDTNSGFVSFFFDDQQRKLKNATIELMNGKTKSIASANDSGKAMIKNIEFGTYDIRVGSWGYENKCFDNVVYDCQNDTTLYILEKKIEDNFELDLGWTVSGNEVKGAWVIGEPIGTVDQISVANPGIDASSDCGRNAIMTGNGTGNADRYDVDSTTILRSPKLNLGNYLEPYLVFYTWFYNGGLNPNDQLLISLIDTSGNRILVDTIINRGVPANWELNNIKVADYLNPLALNYIEFEVSDRGSQHIVEAAIDHFFVSEGKYIGLEENEVPEDLTIFPNPFENSIRINSQNDLLSSIQIYDASMRLIKSEIVNAKEFELSVDDALDSGIYFLKLRMKSGTLVHKKIIKQ